MNQKKRWLSFVCRICGERFSTFVNFPRRCCDRCRHVNSALTGARRTGVLNNKWKGGALEWECLQCGQRFTSYRTDGGQPRRFCSWRCSNLFHGQQEDFDMRDGFLYERELMEFLGEQGYVCLRSAGSRGPIDLFAFNQHTLRMIQVKSTYDFARKGNLTVFRQAVAPLLELPCPPNCTKELWVRVMKHGWRYVVLDECGPARDEILTFLKEPSRWIQP